MIKLVVQSGPLQGRVFLPPPGLPVEIGRDRDCFVRIETTGVSRRHAVLSPKGKDWHIRDAGSRNGTYVNGHRVSQILLRSGDRIRIGEVELTYSQEEKDPWIGRTLAGYRILERLGTGGMGMVYRALQVALDRPVALKILSDRLARDTEFVSRFVEEARSMAKVSHPHVAQVHTVGQQEGSYYLSMEYLEGGSVQDLLDKQASLPPRRATSLMLDAARALIWAEQQGIVHRDIKPGNLLLDKGGRVKVADFGLAADLTFAGAGRYEGEVLGSPHFMAPEQAQGKTVDHRADIYALGSTLYNTLSGKYAFEGKSMKEVLLAKMQGEPVPLSQVAPGVPRELQAIVARAMSRDPEARQQTAQELCRDLQRVLDALPEEERPSRGATPTASPTRRLLSRTRSRRKLLAVTFWVLLLAVGGVLLFWLSGGSFRSLDPVPGETGVEPAIEEGVEGRLETPVVVGPEPLEELPDEGAGEGVARVDPPDDPVEGETPSSPGSGTTEFSEDPGSALSARLQDEIQLLILENRFRDASARLEEHRREHPELAGRIAEELLQVRAAETLFRARKTALDLERAGDLAGARKALTACVDSLPEPYREEALAAIEAIRHKEATADTE